MAHSEPQYWLMKSEPDAFSVDDLAKKPNSPWDGVRNYQARNFMRQMKKEDGVFFYHSSCKIPGIAGIAKITREAYPDFTAWDPKSDYFDTKSSPENPRWDMVDLSLVEKWTRVITLADLKKTEALEGFQLLKKGNRLSVMPVSHEQWHHILTLKNQLTSQPL
ncbi:EVE domain-containing protein [Alteromonas sediminis]|uniref:EVE domain-containing protein n=1 Tax=Alteromonas sediminis TaxID=2259342 RepID=A0A3N5Y532_9ALTE|nr:EVE domain-containing protein [Alteromonas sediminis]RPJ68770.1 EVE domain-containing protein [Alteromonas sediminis]